MIVQEEWEEFLRVTMPQGAGDVQRREMRRAFFAGAYVLFHRLMTQLEPGKEATEADLAMLDELHAELLTWSTDPRGET